MYATLCINLRQSRRAVDLLMSEFGSFSLLLALVLSGYTLLAGGVALRQLATGYRGRISPDRLAETARRAGIGSFFAVTCAAFALVYTAFTNDFSSPYFYNNWIQPTLDP